MGYSKKITDWDCVPVLIDIETACQILQCCDNTVVKHIKNGDFKGNRLGKSWLIDRDSIREFFQKSFKEV